MPVMTRQLPQSDRVVTKRKFLSGAEHAALLGWAEEQFAGGHLITHTGDTRHYRSYDQADAAVPALFWDVRSRAISAFSVTDFEDEPLYKCFLGCNTEGGFVQPHRDKSPPGKYHVRMNIMLSKPLSGGEPVIGGKRVQIEERDLWCFYPSIMVHESTPVRGSRKRFVISIGILVPADDQAA
jgi:hypothetical protein